MARRRAGPQAASGARLASLENYAALRVEQKPHRSLALGANPERIVGDFLELLEPKAALTALIFIGWHAGSFPLRSAIDVAVVDVGVGRVAFKPQGLFRKVQSSKLM
jgi:hypothetical protein